jgi:hypothetical protein
MRRRTLVCLMGPAAAGKSTLAKELERRHPESFARVPVDYFFSPRPGGVPFDQYFAQPLEYDWAAVDAALASTGPRRTTPDCDFDQFTWRSPTGGRPIRRAPIYLLDGMRPHPGCSFLVVLELDATTQHRRLVERDLRWGTRVADRCQHLAMTYAAGLRELPRPPDLRLSGTDTLATNAHAVHQALRDRYFLDDTASV